MFFEKCSFERILCDKFTKWTENKRLLRNMCVDREEKEQDRTVEINGLKLKSKSLDFFYLWILYNSIFCLITFNTWLCLLFLDHEKIILSWIQDALFLGF